MGRPADRMQGDVGNMMSPQHPPGPMRCGTIGNVIRPVGISMCLKVEVHRNKSNQIKSCSI